MASKSKSIIGGMTVLGIAGIIGAGDKEAKQIKSILLNQSQTRSDRKSNIIQLLQPSADNLTRRAARRGQPNGILRAGKG